MKSSYISICSKNISGKKRLLSLIMCAILSLGTVLSLPAVPVLADGGLKRVSDFLPGQSYIIGTQYDSNTFVALTAEDGRLCARPVTEEPDDESLFWKAENGKDYFYLTKGDNYLSFDTTTESETTTSESPIHIAYGDPEAEVRTETDELGNTLTTLTKVLSSEEAGNKSVVTTAVTTILTSPLEGVPEMANTVITTRTSVSDQVLCLMDGSSAGDKWNYDYDNAALSCLINDEEYYLSPVIGPDGQVTFGCSTEPCSGILIYTYGNAAGNIITREPRPVPYYVRGDAGYTDIPVFSVEFDVSGLTNVSCQWYLNGKPVAEGPVLALPEFASMPVGVHGIFCQISGQDSMGTWYREESSTVNFIVCSGVIENSFLTFSDVHNYFTAIGHSIQNVMNANEGKIPALIICTGDWSSLKPSADYETTAHKLIPALKAQFSGIDSVFLSGNHDDGLAALDETVKANLGYDEELGIIYDSRENVRENVSANSSLANEDLIVYGLFFDEIMLDEEYSYTEVLPKLKGFLEELKNNYHNELIVISSHTGLHAIGVQPESAEYVDKPWLGDNAYNVSRSDEVVSLLNHYADSYGMDIVFLFGHDHSKGEKEFTLNYGDTIYSVVDGNEETCETQDIHFVYSHAGYTIENVHGGQHYSFFTWNDEDVSRLVENVEEGTASCESIGRNASDSFIHVTGLRLEGDDTLLMEEGGSAHLQVSVSPSDATNKDVTWSSSDPDVVTISDGNATALQTGSAVITISSSDGDLSVSWNISVRSGETIEEEIEINDITYTVEYTDTVPFNEKGHFQYGRGREKKNKTYDVDINVFRDGEELPKEYYKALFSDNREAGEGRFKIILRDDKLLEDGEELRNHWFSFDIMQEL